MTRKSLNPIAFNYSDEDLKLFNLNQHEHWRTIEDFYSKLSDKYSFEIRLPQKCTSTEWVVSRANLHVSQSLLRLLYLSEAFCTSSKEFNIVSSAALIKAMTEIPLHVGYILWVLRNYKNPDDAREELMKLAIGNRDPRSGFTSKNRVFQKDLYIRSDEVIRDLFGDRSPDVGIFETLYKDSNVVGHNNFEARMLTSIQDSKEGIWREGSRKDVFVRCVHDQFPLFFYCDAILSLSYVLSRAVDRQLKNVSD